MDRTRTHPAYSRRRVAAWALRERTICVENAPARYRRVRSPGLYDRASFHVYGRDGRGRLDRDLARDVRAVRTRRASADRRKSAIARGISDRAASLAYRRVRGGSSSRFRPRSLQSAGGFNAYILRDESTIGPSSRIHSGSHFASCSSAIVSARKRRSLRRRWTVWDCPI
jgi:hypothetical protein